MGSTKEKTCDSSKSSLTRDSPIVHNFKKMSSTTFSVPQARIDLHNDSLSLSQRYRALFALKHHACLSPPTTATIPAIEAIASCLAETSSALLKHELAYCLGQTRNPASVPPLRRALLNFEEDAMVRHESAEALGALSDIESLDILRQRRDDIHEKIVVRETCEIAIGKIEWEISQRGSESVKTRLVLFFSN